MPFHITVVGTGVAGLTAAIALARHGHNVTVLEAAAHLRPIGGVIVLQANANRALHSLGIYGRLSAYFSPISHGPSTRRYDDGAFLAQTSGDAHEVEYGFPLRPVHRADLQRVLYELAIEIGVRVRLGCLVTAIDESGARPVVTVNGQEIVASDLLIGADGINSAVRRSIVPDSGCVVDSGIDITRGNVPANTITLGQSARSLADHISLWCGPNSSVAVMAVRQGNERTLSLDCCHPREFHSSGLPERRQDLDRLKAHYKCYDSAIQDILSHVTEAHTWALMEARPPAWVGHSGKVVLIGDAAHASMPWAGQGGGMAIEDAVSLAVCLERVRDVTDIPAMLYAFQDIRRPRCQRVQDWSLTKGQRARLAGGAEMEQRDLIFATANAWIKAEPWNKVHIDDLPAFEAPNWKAWLCGHDAVDFTNRELDKRFGPWSRED